MGLRQNPPRGVTPIALRLAEIRQRVASEAQELAARGQLIFLTIVTDGLPTSSAKGTSTERDREDLVEELRRLAAELPVQLVVRLCTDEDDVVAFYDKIDEEMELPLDVLDDLKGEAQQLAEKGNDWFVYTPLLHRIREAGTLCKLLDDLDERRFSQFEARRLVQLLSPDPAPELSSGDVKAFLASAARVASAGHVFDPLTSQRRPFVDSKKLGRLMRPAGAITCLAWCS